MDWFRRGREAAAGGFALALRRDDFLVGAQHAAVEQQQALELVARGWVAASAALPTKSRPGP
jgi:hypothetical protein